MPLRVRRKVERGSSKLIYLQVKEMLRSSIERGELKPGEPLPGRVKLCAKCLGRTV